MQARLRFGLMGLAGLVLFPVLHAAAQTVPPAGAKGICRDGTYSTAAERAGACRGHKGVQTWYADSSTAVAPAGTPAPAAMPAPTQPAAAPAMPAPAPGQAASMPAAPPATHAKRLSPAQAAAARPLAPGGGAGMVWVNLDSKVYHCEGSPFYGRTSSGKYMTETDAKAMGAKGVRGASCTAVK